MSSYIVDDFISEAEGGQRTAAVITIYMCSICMCSRGVVGGWQRINLPTNHSTL